VPKSHVKRRLAAILAGDIAGYSRLTAVDEAGTHHRVKTLRRDVITPIVQAHEGRIVRFVGDGALVEFASVVGATECAMQIQHRLAELARDQASDQQLLLRLGIHLGEVIADEEDIFGDGVNIAARLEQLAEPGGLCISDRVYEEVSNKVEATFEPGGRPPLKNIAKPVDVYFWTPRPGPSPLMAPPLPDKPSLAVMPFDNLSGNPEDDHLADGLVEDLTTALGRLNWLFVVARTSTFVFKGRRIDIRAAATQLGVRYVLEGSVRRAGERVRVTGQLIDAATGTHCWAHRFDGRLEDIFELQDEITALVVAAIEPSILRVEIEKARATRPEDLRAHHFYHRALDLMGVAFANALDERFDLARGYLARAIELDPNYAPALALAAFFETKALLFGQYSDRAATEERALELGERAIRADPVDPMALGCYAFVLATMSEDLDRAAALVDRALAVSQNSPLIWSLSGEVRMYLGDHDTAIEHFQRAIRLNPLVDTWANWITTFMAFALFFKRRTEEALQCAEKAALTNRNPVTYRILAATRAEAGRIEAAHEAIQELLRLQPNSCLRRSRQSSYRRPEDLERYVEALRKAGLPE